MSKDHILSANTIERLIPAGELSIEEIEARYPARSLPDGAEVLRVAPSPTGFMHLGTIYMALMCKLIAHHTNGVYCLRLEDTDQKREVEGARELIMEVLEEFGLQYDEGPTVGGEKGDYGPYTQSQRRGLYQAYVRRMLEQGNAYPCFMTPEELQAQAAEQTAQKLRPGYYGQWAAWRDRPEADVVSALDAGKPFVIRFRSQGDPHKKRVLDDRIMGRRELPENDTDIVLIKRDGLPTYHMAHVVDDHLMHTTTILRADEWLASATLHLQLAEAAGIKPFTYAHAAPIQKMDGSSRRKLSKRKDPEANSARFLELGYPPVAVAEYLLTIANSNFEDWRRANPGVSYQAFPFKLEKMPKNSGALLDMQKLDDVSRDYLATLTPAALFDLAVQWGDRYDPELSVLLQQDRAYAEAVFAIERTDGKRKDLAKLSDLRESYGFFFDDLYKQSTDFDFGKVANADAAAIVKAFLDSYSPDDDQETWFEKVKQLGSTLGFTPDTREYRQNPDAYKGSVAEVAMVLRVALTGRNRSPNLHEVMRAMGTERVTARLKNFLRP